MNDSKLYRESDAQENSFFNSTRLPAPDAQSPTNDTRIGADRPTNRHPSTVDDDSAAEEMVVAADQHTSPLVMAGDATFLDDFQLLMRPIKQSNAGEDLRRTSQIKSASGASGNARSGGFESSMNRSKCESGAQKSAMEFSTDTNSRHRHSSSSGVEKTPSGVMKAGSSTNDTNTRPSLTRAAADRATTIGNEKNTKNVEPTEKHSNGRKRGFCLPLFGIIIGQCLGIVVALLIYVFVYDWVNNTMIDERLSHQMHTMRSGLEESLMVPFSQGFTFASQFSVIMTSDPEMYAVKQEPTPANDFDGTSVTEAPCLGVRRDPAQRNQWHAFVSISPGAATRVLSDVIGDRNQIGALYDDGKRPTMGGRGAAILVSATYKGFVSINPATYQPWLAASSPYPQLNEWYDDAKDTCVGRRTCTETVFEHKSDKRFVGVGRVSLMPETHNLSPASDGSSSLSFLFLLSSENTVYFGERAWLRFEAIFFITLAAGLYVSFSVLILVALIIPIQKMKHNFELAASLKNDEVVPHGSMLLEMDWLCRHFDTMNERLGAARAFMPAWMLVTTGSSSSSDDDDDTRARAASGRARRRSEMPRPGCRRARASMMTGSSATDSSPASPSVLTQRRVAILSIDVRGFIGSTTAARSNGLPSLQGRARSPPAPRRCSTSSWGASRAAAA